MTERTYTLLRAILYLKDALGSENIFCKMDSYLKKINQYPQGKKGKSVENFLIYICLPKKKIDEQFSHQCLFKQIFEKGQQDRKEKGGLS